MTLTRLNGDFAWAAFAQAHEALPERPALCPDAVPLALPSMAPVLVLPFLVVQRGSVPEVRNDPTPMLALALYPAVLPMAFSQILDPYHSISSCLTAALPLAIASWVTDALTVPVSPAVIPVLKKACKPNVTEETEQDKTSRKRSPKTTAAGTQ